MKLPLSLLLLSATAALAQDESPDVVAAAPVIPPLPKDVERFLQGGDDDDDDSGSGTPVAVGYVVGLSDGFDSSMEDEYAEQLDTSMTTLATAVVDEIFTRRMIRRKLAVTIETPAKVEGFENPSFDCKFLLSLSFSQPF